MSRQSPRYSIVIPAYNVAAYISETIASVLTQSETDWELIVVDDGSSDATSDVAGQFVDPRITLIRQQNQGASVARNTGFAASRGEYLLFLDGDDVLYPDALCRLGKALDEHPEAVLSYGTYACFETTPPPPSAARAPLSLRRQPNGEALAALLTQNWFGTSAALARREAVARTGGFEPGLRIAQDWLFWCDMAALGPIRYIGRRPVEAYRVGHPSASRHLAVDPKAPFPAIDRVFARDAVRQRFSAKELARLRRRAEGMAWERVGREFARRSAWRDTRRALVASLARDPAKPGIWLLLAFALVGWLPGPARRLFA